MLRNDTQGFCLFCGEPFKPYRSWQKYCSPHHRHMAWISRNPQKHRASGQKWREEHREQSLASNFKGVKKWKAKNLEKVKANIQARNIPLANHCENCGATEKLVKHHPDYSKPLEVVTLCRICHKKAHKQ